MMEPHKFNTFLLVILLMCLLGAAVAILSLLVQPPLKKLKQRYFPGEQEYELIV